MPFLSPPKTPFGRKSRTPRKMKRNYGIDKAYVPLHMRRRHTNSNSLLSPFEYYRRLGQEIISLYDQKLEIELTKAFFLDFFGIPEDHLTEVFKRNSLEFSTAGIPSFNNI